MVGKPLFFWFCGFTNSLCSAHVRARFIGGSNGEGLLGGPGCFVREMYGIRRVERNIVLFGAKWAHVALVLEMFSKKEDR